MPIKIVSRNPAAEWDTDFHVQTAKLITRPMLLPALTVALRNGSPQQEEVCHNLPMS